jgi:hypothetical protein
LACTLRIFGRQAGASALCLALGCWLLAAGWSFGLVGLAYLLLLHGDKHDVTVAFAAVCVRWND